MYTKCYQDFTALAQTLLKSVTWKNGQISINLMAGK